MKYISIKALTSLILFLVMGSALKATVFNVKNAPYNATGNGITDDWSAVNNAIQAAVTAGPGSVVYFPGGTNSYYLASGGTLHIDNANGVTVQGDSGTTNTFLINGSQSDMFSIYNGSNVVVQSLALDTRPLRFTQGTINSLSSNNTVMSVTIDSGFFSLTNSQFTGANLPGCEVRFWTDPNCLAYDKNISVVANTASLISGSTWSVVLSGAIPTNEVGKKVAIWNDGGGWAFNVKANTGAVTISNFVYYGGGAGAGVGMYQTMAPVMLSHVSITVPPGSGRLISAGGGFDAQGDRGQITFDTVSVSGTETDTLDVGTDLAHINATNSSTQIVVENTEYYQAGDTVQIWDWTFQQEHPRDSATVTAATLNSSNQWVLTLNHAVQINKTGYLPQNDPSGSIQEADGVDRCVNLQDAAPGLLITNCNFQTSGRTFNMKAASCTIVSNTFYQTPWNIFACAETVWHGGPAPVNLTIKGNTFNDIDIAPVQTAVRNSTWPGLCSDIVVTGNLFTNCGAHMPYADGNYNNTTPDIRGAGVQFANVNVGVISNNIFSGNWGTPVVLNNCTNVQVVNNTFTNCHQHYWSDWDSYYACDMSADISITNSSAITISGNVTYNEGPYLGAYVRATQSTNITGLATGVTCGSGTNSPGGFGVVPSGTVGYWQFNNSGSLGADSSGQNNTLTNASGSPTYSASGKFGGALYLDGNSTMTTLSGAFPNGVPSGANPYTIAIWEKADTGCSKTGGFIGWGAGNDGENNLRLGGTNGVVNYWLGNDNTASGLGMNLMDGNWHTIVATWDGTNQTIYVDTANVQVRMPSLAPAIAASNFVIGKTLADANFKGWVDNLLIVNRAISAPEVNNYQVEFVPPAPTVLTATAGDAQVSLSWPASAGATSYNVKRSTSSGGEATVASPTTSTYTDTGLSDGTKYYYVVSAVNAYGESINSGEINATPMAEALPAGTVGYWPFTNSSNLGEDYSGQGNNLKTNTGAPAWSSSGKFVGGSLFLNGSSTMNSVSGVFPTGVPTGGSAYTIAVWEKAATNCPNNGGFVGWGDDTTGEANDLRLNGTSSVDNYWWANDFVVSGMAVNPMDGNWHAIVVTWDGTTETMYVDTVNVGTRTPTAPNVQAANFIVGATTGDVDFAGNVQNLLIVNVALTPAQIANYQSGFATVTNYSPVVWYKANAITGVGSGSELGTWSDSSGNGNNATQAVSSNQPTYVTNAMSGLPVVRFNSASSTYMSFTRPVSNDFTMTFVYQSSQGIGTGTQFYQGAGLVNGEVAGVANDFGTSLNTNGYILAGTGNPDTTITSTNGYNDGHPHVVTFKRTQSAGALVLYVDGSQVATGTAGTQSLTAPAQLVLGAQQTLNNYLSGDIAEVQIYNVALSDTQRQALESGLISEYAVGLPSPWQSQDINASLPGGASYSNGVFTVVGSGSDIYNTADGFRFVNQSGSGDCSVVAEINSVSNTDANAKGAVMIRETLNTGSTMATAIVNPNAGVQFIYRTTTGGSAVATTAVGVSFPIWLKVTRVGNSFSGYYSSNGSTWTQMGTSQTISMATATQIGLAVTSHNTGSLCTAIFSNVTASP